MPTFSRWLFRLAVVAAIVVVGWRLLSGQREPLPPVGQEEARSDYYVTGARLVRTDAQGRPQYEITAARLTHLPEQDAWQLEAPAVQVFTDNGAPWLGRGERGRVWAGGDEAELLGAVRLWRDASPSNRPVALDTSDVYLRPRERYAQTERPVVVRQQDNRVSGVGARVYFDQERYQLLSEVQGRYVPQPD